MGQALCREQELALTNRLKSFRNDDAPTIQRRQGADLGSLRQPVCVGMMVNSLDAVGVDGVGRYKRVDLIGEVFPAIGALKEGEVVEGHGHCFAIHSAESLREELR